MSVYSWEIGCLESLFFLPSVSTSLIFLGKSICFQGIYIVSVTDSGCLTVHDFETLYSQSKVGPGEPLNYAYFVYYWRKCVSLFEKLCFWAGMHSKFYLSIHSKYSNRFQPNVTQMWLHHKPELCIYVGIVHNLPSLKYSVYSSFLYLRIKFPFFEYQLSMEFLN